MAPAFVTPTMEYEAARWAEGYRRVAGVDEVGAGPLAGPVLSCAVMVEPNSPLGRAASAGAEWRAHLLTEGVDMPIMRDSKGLSPRQIAAAASWVMGPEGRAAGVAGWALGAVSARLIDRINIRRARALSMDRALQRLARSVGPLDHIVIDGTTLPLTHAHAAVVKGDAHVLTLSLASAVAKYVRDTRIMSRLAARYPGYGWEKNAGYGAAVHLAALTTHGVTAHHRQSYRPVREAMKR